MRAWNSLRCLFFPSRRRNHESGGEVEEDDEEKEKKRKEKNTNTFFDYFLCVFVGKKISLLDVVYIPNKHQAHYHSRGISKAIDNNR
jgi:hypothetical protein